MRLACLSSACIGLACCTVGPDYVAPTVDAPASYDRAASASQPSETVMNAIDPVWWNTLNDPLLNQLIAQAVAENLDLLTATAQLEESRSQRRITAADFYPQVNGDASYTREKLSDKGVISVVGGGKSMGGSAGGGSNAGSVPNAQSIPPFNIYQYGLDVSWELDLWGRVRRGIEASDANTQASTENRRAVALSTVAELVSDYIRLRGTQASLATVRNDVEDARKIAHLTHEKARVGLSSEIDVAKASAQSLADEAQIPQLEQQQASLMNAIALLLAKPPGALVDLLAPEHPLPPLPSQVPIGLPSELALRRPDVREAEAQLHEATANIGVAVADFFPKVTLMGDGMLQALTVRDLGDWAARAYSFGPSVTLPIFEGGRLAATLELRKASEREAALQYRKTILTAFHEVDNALTTFRAEQTRGIALTSTVDQDRLALCLATDRYAKGLGDFLTVLTDEQNLLAAQRQAIQSQQTAGVNMVQLYKALGGGWEMFFP